MKLKKNWQRKEFGKLIRNQRLEKGLRQKQLSQMVGINATYMSKIEKAELIYPPTKIILDQLAKFLELDTGKLYVLTGRLTEQYEHLFLKHRHDFPFLLQAIEDNVEFALDIFAQARSHLSDRKA